MLSKEIFKTEMERLKRFYPNWPLDISCKLVMIDWYSMFKKMNDREFERMIVKHIENEKFNPTIATLNNHREKLVNGAEVSTTKLTREKSMFDD